MLIAIVVSLILVVGVAILEAETQTQKALVAVTLSWAKLERSILPSDGIDPCLLPLETRRATAEYLGLSCINHHQCFSQRYLNATGQAFKRARHAGPDMRRAIEVHNFGAERCTISVQATLLSSMLSLIPKRQGWMPG